MRDFLLVDGYNILFADDYMSELAIENLHSARDYLINILENYAGYKNLNIILVFDAHKVYNGIEKTINTGNITIVYTKEAETADAYIERTVSELPKLKDTKISVATSDNIEQLIIMSKGAERISARSLLSALRKANQEIRQKIKYKKPIKNNEVIENLDKETAELLEKMRLNKDL